MFTRAQQRRHSILYCKGLHKFHDNKPETVGLTRRLPLSQAFLARIPGFVKGTGEHQTISFESACAPGQYVRQKNYNFVLGKKGDPKFGKYLTVLVCDSQNSRQAFGTR